MDAEAILWCRQRLPFITFSTNHPSPPLAYEDAKFDLVYAIPVLTHWTPELFLKWLPELRRVLKPHGVLLLTVHGEHIWRALSKPDVQQLESAGFLVKVSRKLTGVLPPWYQTAFYSRAYAERVFAQYFDRRAYTPRAFGDQDAILGQSQ